MKTLQPNKINSTAIPPFGMGIKTRNFVEFKDFRYSFNGMEKVDEISGDGNRYDFEARVYDSRLGRWLSLDPSQKEYSGISPYNFTFNNPVIFKDPDGKDARITIQKNPDGTNIITLETTVHIYGPDSKDKASALNTAFQNLNPGPQTFVVDGQVWTAIAKVNYVDVNAEILQQTTEFNRGIVKKASFEESNLKDFSPGDNILMMDKSINLSPIFGEGTVGASGVGNSAGIVGAGSNNITAVHETYHMLGFNDVAGLGEKGPDLMEYNDAGQKSVKEFHFYDLIKYAIDQKLENGTYIFDQYNKKIDIDTKYNYDKQENVKSRQKEAKSKKVIDKKK